MSHLYLDVHVLQTVPPSNLNRDDAGSPKQAIYGGVRRARVSSQSWKRATRKYFEDAMPRADQATRTKQAAALLTNTLADKAALERGQAARVAAALLTPLKITVKKNKDGTPDVDGDTAYLLFFGRTQLDRIAERAAAVLPGDIEGLTDDEIHEAVADIRAQEGLMTGHPLGVALFGRMVADLPALNVDASVQIAHALSTHSVELEYDYFTAVDDEKRREAGDDVGAEMIGTVEFNSATLYRYATIGIHQLADNLGGDEPRTIDGVTRFIEGFVRSMPTGHQNTFAHRTLPDAVVVVARSDQPVNLVSAFEAPVRRRDGYQTPSLAALASEYARVDEQWGGHPQLVASLFADTASQDVRSSFGQPGSFDDLLMATGRTVTDHLSQGTS
jgi:CRISPR system Cascade subunit CasC